MWRREQKEVGPSPMPSHLYAQRQLPIQKALFWLGRTALALGTLGLIMSVLVVSLYRIPDGSGILFWLSNRLPLPAMAVNGKRISIKEYRLVSNGWTKLYATHGKLDSKAESLIDSKVYDRMVRDVLVIELMGEHGETLTDELIAIVYDEFVDQYPTEAHFVEGIDRQFGWSQEEFSRLIVEPLARTRLIADSVGSWTDVQERPYEVIQELHGQIFQNNDRFAEIAQEVSMSLSASDGGELGLRSIDEYPVEARDLLLSLDEGFLTSVIETRDRYIIYQINKREQRDSGFLVDAREVSIDKRDVYDVLAEKLDEAVIEYYLK